MANTKLRVTFVDISVAKDGDPLDRGEIYWSFKVDGAVVSSRPVANPYKIGSGGTIALGASATVTKSNTPGSNLTVSGSLSEKDAGKDETDSFQKRHTQGDNWGTSSPQQFTFADKNLNATLHYLVERV